MKRPLPLLCLILLLNFNYQSAFGQCGIIFNYSYVVGPCDTSLHSVNLFLSGSTSPYTVLWENNFTAMSNQLDTGYHTVCVWDNSGCLQCDTFTIACVGWNGNANLNEIRSDFTFNIFPNPSAGKFVLGFAHEINSGTIQIFNLIGKMIFEDRIRKESIKEINLKNISKGIYIIKALTDGKQAFQKIIIE